MPTPGTLRQLCGPARSGGYIYALSYSTGLLQVGRTRDARAEMAERRSAARSVGVAIVDWWFSPAMRQWIGGERQLAAACRALGGLEIGTRSFSGVDFAALCEKARGIDYDFAVAQHPYAWTPDQRMAIAARLRAEGLSLRDSANQMLVSYGTVRRDLIRWDRVKGEMPEEITRLSAPVTRPCYMRPVGSQATPGDASDRATNVTAARNTTPNVIPLRRPA